MDTSIRILREWRDFCLGEKYPHLNTFFVAVRTVFVSYLGSCSVEREIERSLGEHSKLGFLLSKEESALVLIKLCLLIINPVGVQWQNVGI